MVAAESARELLVLANLRARLTAIQVQFQRRNHGTWLNGPDPALVRFQQLAREYECAAQEAKRLLDAMKEAV